MRAPPWGDVSTRTFPPIRRMCSDTKASPSPLPVPVPRLPEADPR